MGLNFGQVPVSTAPTLVFIAPPGNYNVNLYSRAATVLLGSQTQVAATTGYLVSNTIATRWHGYQGSSGAQIWAVNNGSGTVTVTWILSEAQI